MRKATEADVPALRNLIEASVRGLQTEDYLPEQIEAALRTVYGVDTQLIMDETYFVAESIGAQTAGPKAEDATLDRREGGGGSSSLVGCGGWSKRKTLFGGDQWNARQDDLLDPATDAAKIRAFFVRPDWARRGIGTMILEACEKAAKTAGFKRLEMGATISGVEFYKARGYQAKEAIAVPLGGGQSMPIVRMAKAL
ncbi:MAG TPA: GNAT family N-acetyltransferase [Candidatus Cybelea sp.]|nr:GNAT family N-acetyltransferase [Candidatus Cybelea sp.]